MLIFKENDAKQDPQGDPKILKNPQKSSKVLPKLPSDKELYADLKKSSKIHDFRVG